MSINTERLDKTYCEVDACAFGRQIVSGEGAVPSEILLIGEAPGRMELRAGRPFIGPAGQLLNNLLLLAGLRREEVYITNACGCVDMGREDRRPLPIELSSCRPRVDQEILRCNSKVVILMGNTALSLFFPGFRIGEIYNTWRATEGRIIIPTYHPAAVLRGNKQLESIILEALKSAKHLIGH